MHFCRLCPSAVLALRYAQPALSKLEQSWLPSLGSQWIFFLLTHYVDSLNNTPLPLPHCQLLLPLQQRTQGNHKVMLHMALAEYAGGNRVLIRERG